MTPKNQRPALWHRLFALCVIAVGRMWFLDKGQNRVFRNYVLGCAWQWAFGKVMPDIRTKSGFLLAGPSVDYTADWIRVFGNHEISTERFIHDHIKGGVLLDIGANIGYYSFYAALAANARSVAFEPNDDVLMFLKRSLELNQASERVEIIPFAVGDSDTTAYLQQDDVRADTGLGRVTTRQDIEGRQEVRVKRLDTLEKERGLFTNVTVVKIDVEGMEMQVLKGMGDFLKREKPALAVEDIPENYDVTGRYAGDLDEFLLPLGYVEDVSYPLFDQYPTNRFYIMKA